MKPGDVTWVAFPGGAGRAQAGRRPAIVFQADETSRIVPTVLVVPLPTQKDALRFPGTILIDLDFQNGLTHPSIALVFQLTAIDRKYLGPKRGNLSAILVHSLWTALDEILGRESIL